jgi:DNA modification methylase
MVKEYTCEKCGKVFSQKGHFMNHQKRKRPCKPIENKVIEEKVQEKLQELSENNNIKFENLISNNQNNITTNITMDIQNKDGLDYLSTIDNNSIDLVLTDPPYITSTETGMGNLHKQIKENKEKGIEYVKTEEEWESVKDKYIDKKNMSEEKMKQNFMKYGSIFGSKYSVQTEYGEWDTSFTMEILDNFISEYYKKLKKGGTMIIFFDIWKITPLKELMEKHKFKQIRFIEWIKTNPQPLNSKTNYLTNCREMALLGVKGGKPTFNSSYDNAIYQYPIQGGKKRFHPTQKSLPLFEELIRKHSEEGDVVLDTFLGGGTTAIASKNTKRRFMGCEVSKEYYDKLMELV